MVPEGYRSLLRRGRNRLRIEAQDTWDRFVSSDPGLARLFKGLRAVAAVGTTIVVQLLVAMAIGVEGQTRLLHLMLGALIAMNLSTLVRPGRRRELVRAGVWAPIAASLGAAVAIVTAPITWLALGTLRDRLFGATWVTVLLLTVVYHDPRTRLRRTVTALRARARAVVSHYLDLLRNPVDERRVRSLRAQLVKLAEVTLLFDGQLSDTRALPSGTSPTRLRRWIVEAEIS